MAPISVLEKIIHKSFLSTIFISLLICKITASYSDDRSNTFCISNQTPTDDDSYEYQSNLDTLLANLIYTSSSLGFSNYTAGNSPYQVYGRYPCRGDTSPQLCRDCVGAALDTLSKTCPSNKEAITYRDNFMLHYANYSLSSMVETSDPSIMCSSVRSKSRELFNHTMEGMVEDLIEDAAFNSKSLFVTQEVDLDLKDGRLYGLAQCTPDLGRHNCSACLKTAISYLEKYCEADLYAEAQLPSCWLRYDNVSFYGAENSTAPAASTAFGVRGRFRHSCVAILLCFVMICIVDCILSFFIN